MNNCIENFKKIQEDLLDFMNNDTNIEEKFQDLISLIENSKINEDRYKLNTFLHMIAKIANNLHRCSTFFNKIERILHLFSDKIEKYFTNREIFQIFKGNKRIILFLIDEKLIVLDKQIVFKIIERADDENGPFKYPQYFAPEIREKMNEKWFPKDYTKEEIITELKKEDLNLYEEEEEEEEFMEEEDAFWIYGIKWLKSIKKEIPENFNEFRKIGENDSYICKLIRDDSLNEFIVYVNSNNCQLKSPTSLSVYETNSFLIKRRIYYYENEVYDDSKDHDDDVTLIKYAAFFGSIKIFKYLMANNVPMYPSLWLYAIHSNNSEIIHLLEDKQILPDEKMCKEILKETLKCHNADLTNYILNNYIQNAENIENEILINSLKNYNFLFINNELIDENIFYYLCKYDYYNIVDFLLNEKDIDVNNIILINLFNHVCKNKIDFIKFKHINILIQLQILNIE